MNTFSLSSEALIANIFSYHWQDIDSKMLNHLSEVVNYNNVPDSIIDIEEVRNVVKWNKIDRMKLVRILIRCLDKNIDVLQNIDFKKFDYKIKDLTFLLIRKPEYLEHFKIDLNKLTTLEAAYLLSLGSDYFLKKIDFKNYKFNFNESMNIIKAYKYERDIIKKVNYKSLNSHQVSEILINTGEQNLDLLNLSILTNIDWLNLLHEQPNMIKYCEYNKFMIGDVFYSIRLYCMFMDDITLNIVLNRNMNEISPFGWEKLLIKNLETFLPFCNLDKLEDTNWNNIIKIHPHFISYKLNR